MILVSFVAARFCRLVYCIAGLFFTRVADTAQIIGLRLFPLPTGLFTLWYAHLRLRVPLPRCDLRDITVTGVVISFSPHLFVCVCYLPLRIRALFIRFIRLTVWFHVYAVWLPFVYVIRLPSCY